MVSSLFWWELCSVFALLRFAFINIIIGYLVTTGIQPFKSQDQNVNSHLLPPYICGRE